MKNTQFSRAESMTGSTVTDMQKQEIIEAILFSIRNTPYHDGLEIKACNAVSAINKYSDAEIKCEIVDNETGERFGKVGLTFP